MRQVNGRRFLITGATGSLGRATALRLCEMGAALVLPVRSPERGEALRRELLTLCPTAELSFPLLDLGDEESVYALAEALLKDGRPLDGLILNAGVFIGEKRKSRHGNEWHMQVNCISPALLTACLLPLLGLSADPCVVTVTSLAAFWFRKEGVSPTRLYAGSKQSFLREIAHLSAKEPNISFVFAHPGICATGLFGSRSGKSPYPPLFLRFALPLMKWIFPKPERACRTTLHALLEADGGQLAEPDGFLHIWGKPFLVPLCKRFNG